MRVGVLCIFFILFTLRLSGIPDSLRFYLLTADVGENIYEKYGHTGIRITSTEFDYVLNYGVFDDSDPMFIINFLKGKMRYKLDDVPSIQFIDYYKNNKRQIIQNEILLDSTEKAKYFEYLLINLQPQNKYYQYDFLRNNCATKVFDGITNTVTLDVNGFKQRSFRQMLDEYSFENSHWYNLGTNLLLGLSIDSILGFESQIFLPQVLQQILTNSRHKNLPILGPDQVLHRGGFVIKKTPFYLSPFFLIGLVILVLLSFYFNSDTQKFAKLIIGIFHFILMTLILFMWFGTDHLYCRYNQNILWVLPAIWICDSKIRTAFGIFYLLLTLISILGIIYFHPIVLMWIFMLCIIFLHDIIMENVEKIKCNFKKN